MAAFTVRSVRSTDAADLQQNCFSEQALDQVQDYLRWCLTQQAKGRIVRLVAEMDTQVIANGQLTILRDRGEIGSLVVAVPYRQRGIATALIQALIDTASEYGVRILEITAHTDRPWIRAWYERLGFTFQRDHTFPGSERVAVLQMALTHQGKETQCLPIKA
jgi:ribosomal protein S18 acetylase RimI-like enzyme